MLFNRPTDLENYSEEEKKNFFENMFEVKEYPHFQAKMGALIKELSDKQQKVLYLIYWKNKTLTEIANISNTHKSSVLKIRDRALVQLGKKFVLSTATVLSDANKAKKKDSNPVAPGNKGNFFPMGREGKNEAS